MNAAPVLNAGPLIPPPPGAMTPPPAPRKQKSKRIRSTSPCPGHRTQSSLRVTRFPCLFMDCATAPISTSIALSIVEGAMAKQVLLVQVEQLPDPFVIATVESSKVEITASAIKLLFPTPAPSNDCDKDRSEDGEDAEMQEAPAAGPF